MQKKTEAPNCKHCGSNNVYKNKQAGYAVLLSLLLFGLPIPFFKRTYFCFDCRAEWKVEK